MTKVTIGDIAREANVSKMTVSRALRGIGRMRDETRERIIRVAGDLGYRPNLAAKAVSTGRFGCVSLLLSTNRFYSHLPSTLIDGIHAGLEPHNLHLIVAKLADEQLTSEGYVPKMLREWTSDGLLINYHFDIPQKMKSLIKRYRLPSIWLNSKQPVDCVYPDDFGGARLATEKLIEAGHKRVAYVDFAHTTRNVEAHHYSAMDRQLGYEAAMKEAGLQINVIRPMESQMGQLDRVGFALEALSGPNRPTALTGYSTSSIGPFIVAARSRGWRVPHELSVVSIESSRSADRTMGVSLSAVVVPYEDVGRRAAEMVAEKLDDPTVQFEPSALPFGYAANESVAPPAD